MDGSPRRPWLGAAVLVGIGYSLVGILFGLPATHVQAWRLAAWAVSAIAYATHIWYERFRLRSSPRSAALHVALAVALAALSLAVRANLHSLSTGSAGEHRQILLLSLAIWPLMTALPAFLVALGVSAALARVYPIPQAS